MKIKRFDQTAVRFAAGPLARLPVPIHAQENKPARAATRALINGEIRLWGNGEEVSGGTNIEPRKGDHCLESEGAVVEFKNIRIRELP